MMSNGWAHGTPDEGNAVVCLAFTSNLPDRGREAVTGQRQGNGITFARTPTRPCPGFRLLLRRMFEWEYVNWVWVARLAIATLGIVAAVLDSYGALPYP